MTILILQLYLRVPILIRFIVSHVTVTRRQQTNDCASHLRLPSSRNINRVSCYCQTLTTHDQSPDDLILVNPLPLGAPTLSPERYVSTGPLTKYTVPSFPTLNPLGSSFPYHRQCFYQIGKVFWLSFHIGRLTRVHLATFCSYCPHFQWDPTA